MVCLNHETDESPHFVFWESKQPTYTHNSFASKDFYLFIYFKEICSITNDFFWKAATSTNPRYGLGGHSKFLDFFESTFNFEDKKKKKKIWTQQFQIFSTNLYNIFIVLPLTMDD